MGQEVDAIVRCAPHGPRRTALPAADVHVRRLAFPLLAVKVALRGARRRLRRGWRGVALVTGGAAGDHACGRSRIDCPRAVVATARARCFAALGLRSIARQGHRDPLLAACGYGPLRTSAARWWPRGLRDACWINPVGRDCSMGGLDRRGRHFESVCGLPGNAPQGHGRHLRPRGGARGRRREGGCECYIPNAGIVGTRYVQGHQGVRRGLGQGGLRRRGQALGGAQGGRLFLLGRALSRGPRSRAAPLGRDSERQGAARARADAENQAAPQLFVDRLPKLGWRSRRGRSCTEIAALPNLGSHVPHSARGLAVFQPHRRREVGFFGDHRLVFCRHHWALATFAGASRVLAVDV
mmetsp:Transcript_166187/g.533476  ORF Transcript_166187/g.533476 Transcript_166187/m.533476 type:complete len:353 (-) Transcript_166187:3011-4069(-)